MTAFSLALVASASAGVAPLAPARAGLLEPFIDLRTFPQCDDPKVLGKVIEKFNWAEANTWHRGFTVAGLVHPHERMTQSGYEIPRRYCRAQAALSNGKHRRMFYLIEGGQGLAGTGFHVEFCLQNRDEWRVYNGACRTLNW
ncbi:MAG: hypothetical protein AAGM04_04220 [Pseudomonadota bacterium]